VDVREEVEEAARELGSQGVRVTAHRCDVADRAAMERLRDQVLATHGRVHLVVNNAGVSVAGRFAETKLEDFAWIMNVNFWGVVHGCHVFLPVLLEQDEAHIVNVSSSFGLLGMAGKTGYAASKFAVRGFSESLRAELSGTRVGVTVLYPGPVDTGIVQRGRVASEAQREAEAKFLASRSIPAERVARRLLEGIRKDEPRVLLSVDYLAIDALARLSPDLSQALAAFLAKRMPF
jgi:short-subunit dehydrogenase